MKILVKITQEIIDQAQGCQGDMNHCLIARALKDFFPNVAVHLSHAIINNGAEVINHVFKAEFVSLDQIWKAWVKIDKVNKIKLPPDACALIKAFDNGRTIAPCSFEIELSEEQINSIGISQVYKVLSESKTLEYVPI